MSVPQNPSNSGSNNKRCHPANSIFKLSDPAELKPHPFYLSIYGEEDVSFLINLIDRQQWPRPLLVNRENIIINGHQYWKAALSLGLNSIPIEIRVFPNLEAELEALLLENADRNKTVEQKVRSALAWERIEASKAKQRQQNAAVVTNEKLGRKSQQTLQENFPGASTKGQTRDRVANLVGLGSGRNYSKAKKVVAAIDKLVQQGNPDSAVTLRKVLNEQSIDAAAKFLKELSNVGREEKSVEKPSCWNCQHCSREQIKDNHSYYCYKFGFLSILRKDAEKRAFECKEWSYRFDQSQENKSTSNTQVFNISLPEHFKPLIEDAARASGMATVDWVCHHLLEAASSKKTLLEV